MFDVLGGIVDTKKNRREGLGMDPRYMDPNDRRLPNPLCQDLLGLMSSQNDCNVH